MDYEKITGEERYAMTLGMIRNLEQQHWDSDLKLRVSIAAGRDGGEQDEFRKTMKQAEAGIEELLPVLASLPGPPSRDEIRAARRGAAAQAAKLTG